MTGIVVVQWQTSTKWMHKTTGSQWSRSQERAGQTFWRHGRTLSPARLPDDSAGMTGGQRQEAFDG